MEKVKNTPLLTIIVPVYNTEKYLKRCIQSIQDQNYNNIELILVDDGSTDNSGAICDEFAKVDQRIIVIHKRNGGQGSARNSALDIASGSYIAFVDSDDEIAKDTYQENIQILEENKDIDILQYPIVEHYGTAFTINRKIDVPLKIYKTEDLYYSWLSPLDRRVTGYVWSKIYRNSIFEKLRFREDIVWEDRYIECDILKSCKGIYISNIGNYLYYDREGSTVRRERDEYYYKSVCIADSKVIKSIGDIHILNKVRKSRSVLLYYYCIKLAKLGKISKNIWNKEEKQIDVPQLSIVDIIKSGLSFRQKIICLQGKLFGINFIERVYGK